MVWKKIQGWKGKLLSKAGKEVLIKAVAQSIPTYTMGVFQLPDKLCHELNMMCARFWWGQCGDDKKIHWKSWDSLVQPKREGGMGFRDIRSFNLAMLAKQGWRMLTDHNSLLYQCFKAKYFPHCTFLEATDHPHSSYVWKSLIAAQPVLRKGCCWRVGTGSSIRVLSDKWIPNHPTNKILVPPNEIDESWHVSELIDWENFQWNHGFIDAVFNKQDGGEKGLLRCLAAKLRQRRILENDLCPICNRFPETILHALWECGAAQDVWAGCAHRILQKGLTNQDNISLLFENLMQKATVEVLEIFLVLGWLIWHQRNRIVHGGSLQEPDRLHVRASSFLEEYKEAQSHLAVPVTSGHSQSWLPPEGMFYKLNFDAAVFTDASASGVGVIVRNARGEVMAALSSRGSAVMDSEEAEVLACRQAMEFAIDAGFSDLIVEGDNSTVMRSIVSAQTDWSRLGNLYDDIRCLAGRMRHVEFRDIRRSANGVAHSLARFARHISEDIIWLEDSPPPALEALYLDSIAIGI
ncbi:hypothetical protein ACB092_09G103400 [Castanea dentata]